MEIAIIRDLEEKVLEYSQQFIVITHVCAELDWYIFFFVFCVYLFAFSLISLAITAKEHNFTRPTITLENVIHISNGRHPLQEICVDNKFIPNDTSIATSNTDFNPFILLILHR